MFDGAAPAEKQALIWDEEARAGDIVRLLRQYDPLLETPDATLPEPALAELRTLARIHDLDERLPAGLLWRTLRLVIAPRLMLI